MTNEIINTTERLGFGIDIGGGRGMVRIHFLSDGGRRTNWNFNFDSPNLPASTADPPKYNSLGPGLILQNVLGHFAQSSLNFYKGVKVQNLYLTFLTGEPHKSTTKINRVYLFNRRGGLLLVWVRRK